MGKPRFRAIIAGGLLFKAEARTDFLSVTASRYASMKDRLKRKKLPPPPFTLEQLRADLLGVMGGKKDGAIECRYCKRHFVISEIAIDHATPISRRGSLGLENCDYPCKGCNDAKGALSLLEFEGLLTYLESVHPLARKDVLSRLKKANSLAAGARRNFAKSRDAELAERGPIAQQRRLPSPEEEF
jgi:hypothetical protein